MKMTKDVFKFLSSYRPKDQFITSKDEYSLIMDILRIKDMDMAGITELREIVTRFYSDMMREFDDVHDKVNAMYARQSIISVIDNEYDRMTAHGGECPSHDK